MKHDIFNQHSWWQFKTTQQLFIIYGVTYENIADTSTPIQVWVLFEGYEEPEPRPLETMLDLYQSNKITRLIVRGNYS